MTSILLWIQTIQMYFSKKQNISSQSFSAFSKFALNLQQFQKKLTLMASAFLKLPTPKNVLR